MAMLLTGALVLGWAVRGERHLTPEEGVGYILGILGGVLMLLLLAYPLRKRLRILRRTGTVRFWFRTHMLCGILGPVAIMFHANFALGSLNSSLSFLSMLTVMLSGLVGRYLYAQIHHGLHGQRAVARELLADAAGLKPHLNRVLDQAPEIEARIAEFEAAIARSRKGLIAAVVSALAIVRGTRRAERQLARVARRRIVGSRASPTQRRRAIRQVSRGLGRYFAVIRKAAALAAFERLFALWHVLHLPLFVILVVTAILHIVAVHLY